MKIIVASSNKGKIKEIQSFFEEYEVIPYTDVMDKIDIEENGSSFQENAIIKAKAIWEKLKNQENNMVLSDDSGITVPSLNNEPGIYSARYARIGASDIENINCLTIKLKQKEINPVYAFYTVCIAIVSNKGCFTTHGKMRGNVIQQAKGTKGFGYDPIFIPSGYKQTLGELGSDTKSKLSHRTKALWLIKYLL